MTAIENYLILETISDNDRKSVYRCRDTVSQDTVILKVLKSEFTGHEEVMRFKQEYKMLRELSGCVEGVIKPLKLEERNGFFIMVLEDIQGRSLKRIMADDKPDQETLVRLVIKIVDIIGAIHEHHIIHKDIKPSNIVWDREKDVVQVIDFDLAVKLPKEKREFQNSGVLEGSLLYVSPEQTGRMNRNIDYRTDFYSLGVVLYEMITGVKPFESGDMLDQIYSIIAKEAVSPYQLTGGRVSWALSGVIMKLMEKSPEDRYRSAYGIRADLQKCLAGYGDFELAQEDKRNIFRISQKIYGREEELTRLAEAFRTSLRGNPQIMLISGDAGVGKTALVNELHQYISQEKGLFASGKFDQYNQNIPYSAMIQAFGTLINQLVDSPDEDYKKNLEKSLRTALGGNGVLITNIIPELEKLIGVQPEIEPLNPVEEINRFFLTFVNFIEGITNNERPLVLFLDDVQWADLSNLQLMEKLVLSNHLRKLFIVCSCRPHAAMENQPLLDSIAEIDKSREVGNIVLSSLSIKDVENFIADTLNTEPGRVKELAEIIYARTKGNSFFLNEVLNELYKNGFIFFDDLEGKWKWVLAQISDLNINDNVVEFLMMKLQALPEEDQRVLKLCASIGNLFDYKMLSLIAEEEPRVIAKSLIKAMGEDIIIPADTNHSMLPSLLEETEDIPRDINAYFKFQHDRLQQVCYQMIDPVTSKKLHLKIGRLLLMQLTSGEVEEKLVDIVTHINKGIEFIGEEDEANQVIQLNLKAAQKTKAAFGYEAAFAFLEAAVDLLKKSPWRSDERRISEIYRLYAEYGYLTHHTDEADKACAILLNQTVDSFSIAEIYEMQANHYTYLGMMKESIASGKRGLRALGVKIPDKPGLASVVKEFLKVKARLRGMTIEEIFGKPEMKDEKIKLIMRLLINIFPPAFISGEANLFALIVLKKAELTLKYGNCPESAIAFIGYSILLSGFGDLKGAFDFGRLGIRINDKFNDLKWRGASHVLYTLFCHAWNEPWDTLHDWFSKSIESSLRTGDLLYLAHACFYVNLWNPTMDIVTNLHESNRYIAMIENTKYKEALATAKLARQQLLNLAGELSNPLTLDSETFSEKAYVRQLEEAKYYSGIAIYYIYKIKLLFTYESYSDSLAYIDKAYGIIGTLAGSAFMEEFALYTFLNLAYCYKDLSAYDRMKARARMRKEYGRVKKWAAHTPENFLLHERLMKAEWARISGNNELAGKYYDLAIAACEKGNVVRYKALVYELAAKFYNSRLFTEFASYLFRQSLYYYSVWGAKGKIKHINEQYQDIVKYKKEYLVGRAVTDSTESIDLNSILLASQAISKEIELNNLLEALMEIVIKNAGAQRGCILMRSSSDLLVEGEYRPEDDKITVVVHRHSDDYNLPYSIIHAVEESKETLIYKDAFSEAGLINDPYIIRHQPKSLVCMPLINHNKTIAVIYLENNLVTDVFTNERMRIINLLSREMVFSLENASLYSDLERSEEKYRELVNNMLDGIFIIQDMQCKFVNTALARMIGYEMEEMIDQPFDKFIALAQREDVLALHRKRINGIDAPGEYESRLVHKDGKQEIDVILKAIFINYLNKPAVQGTVKDITERKRAEEELRKHKEHLEELVIERTKELKQNNEELNKNILLIEKISITDELTGLYNRRHFNTIFFREVGRAGIEKGYLAYIMLDIDYYKKYNDTYGHYEGDNVLRRLGATIKEQAAKASDYVFRLGGEEFGIIVTGLTPEQSFEYADGIRRSVEELNIPHEMSPVFGYLTVSVGVAAVRVDGLTEKDIYKLADDALYQSKADGRNRVTMLEQ
ncbi:PAS domain S-box-containing protein/diguanylate cyclase (GGDEF) domain-containing protein [Paenibacillus sophorae]|uniref:Diguanylate cyclase n=1 Tax=Paenibacillus sophorae TaxID=1333845 RepID=A0A1H8NNR0_9BACL|nr:diguanylate cyclase [Paenibacillus sophorae]QWU14527.1 diguanylate cyclase [Paenibacillus sophorae]SEO31222.1 PAS domain S-box-containing protein/diguanylate cyclase (GGDEF) domain-containing protein [Paenibacillus sophorae]